MKQITFHMPERTSKLLGRKTLTGAVDGGDGTVEIEVAPDDAIAVPIRAVWGLAAVLDDEGRADTRPLTPRPTRSPGACATSARAAAPPPAARSRRRARPSTRWDSDTSSPSAAMSAWRPR